jgi:hypothetical protein
VLPPQAFSPAPSTRQLWLQLIDSFRRADMAGFRTRAPDGGHRELQK